MDRRGLTIRAALVAAPLLLVGVLAASLLDPSFSWWDGSLSHLGELPGGRGWLDAGLDQPSVLLFNGSLVAAGLLALPFAWLLHGDAFQPLERTGATALVVALLALVAVGSFPQPSPFHVPAAMAFVVATTGFLWIYGSGTLQRGRTRLGAATLALGATLICGWLAWDSLAPSAGMAVPEFLGIAVLAAWTFAAAATELAAAEGRTPVDALASALQTGSAD